MHLHEGQQPSIGQQFPIAEPLRETAGRIVIPAANLEHVSGAGCRCNEAYSGHRISAAEMRGCDTLQGFYKKSLLGSVYGPQKKWAPEPQDHDFETESDYFLTGISDGHPDIETADTFASPVRHGVSYLDCQDTFYGVSHTTIVLEYANWYLWTARRR